MEYTQEIAHLAQNYDIHFDGGVSGFIEDGTNVNEHGTVIPNNFNAIAMDAAMQTSPNSTIPAVLATFVDPKMIDILLAARAATEIFREAKKGDFATKLYSWPVEEIVGETEPYSDFAQSGMSSTNNNWIYRENYAFQTQIVVGDREAQTAGLAKIPLVARRQRAAATNIAIAHNRIFLFGVDGMQNYGILNDPNLLPAIAPLENANEDTEWADKSTKERFNDILAMFRELSAQSGANITQENALTLAVSPSLNVDLAAATDYNISVLDMLDKYFKRLKIVVIPELEEEEGSQSMFMTADDVDAQVTGECVYSEKFRAYPVFRDLSSIRQKVSASSFGGVVYRPVLLVTMTGM